MASQSRGIVLIKRTILTLLFSAAMLYLPSIIEQANGSFRLPKVAIDVPFNPAWEGDAPSPELASLFSKPFHYLGRGMQAFVFASEDGQYVIKLFRASPKIHPWRQFIRTKFLGRNEKRTPREKIELLFGACKLAYSHAADLTGLVYIHLNPTNDLFASTTLVNRMGRKIPVDLNRCRFAIQKRGVSVTKTLKAAIAENDREKYNRLIRSFHHLVEERASRNICNLDKKLGENFGFIGEEAIEWDFGSYSFNANLSDPKAKAHEIEIFAKNLQKFLDRTPFQPEPVFDLKDRATLDVSPSSISESALH